MAAGQGKRMQDPTLPKVLYPLAGKPLVSYVIELCEAVGAARTIVIIGYGRERVREYLQRTFPGVETAIQDQQLGTGHAVQQTRELLEHFEGDVLVLSGDVPLLQAETAERFVSSHKKSGAVASVLSVELENPHGYGRIVRHNEGSMLKAIVEEKDATDEIRAIREINSGIYVFDASVLYPLLEGLRNDNAQGEYYLTDVFAALHARPDLGTVNVVKIDDPIQVAGVNTKDQLLALEQEWLQRALSAGSRRAD